jgi:aryl-alcohol dehydrogenase-like predicted oxidoreductase
LRDALEGSLRRLRLDRIDLYQFHRPDPNVPYAESIGALAELQRAGKIRHIGVSNVSLQELSRAQRAVTVVSVQNRYNATDRDSEEVLKVCERAGMAFIPWFPLGAGRDAAHAPQAIAWLLARSPVILPIPGTSSVAHLEENVAAAALRLSAKELKAME